MKTEAAILTEIGKDLTLTELEIPKLKPGQVLVEIAYSGICRTQISEIKGFKGNDPYLPHCLGHEGSGIVKEIGDDVTKVKPGDKVILSWMKGSGKNIPSTIYKCNEKEVNAGSITTFSKYAVISENRLTVLSEEISLKKAALIGCAVATGVGSILNVAKPKEGQSLAVFGTGGIGLFAVNGAKITNCNPIIAIDVNEDKLELAKKLGATHCINPNKDDLSEEIKKICPLGLDFAIEASGMPSVMIRAIETVRNQGGTVVIIGNAKEDEKLVINPKQFNLGKRILGTWGGDNIPDTHFKDYIELISSGKLELEPFIQNIYSLKQINTAIEDFEKGKTIRPLIDMKK